MTFFHALQINEDQCIGCSHCMKICPTEAIRVYDGKAHISESRCIDCGKCFKTCPTRAVYINQDDFESIFNFPCRVALIPSVFLGQFPNDISVSRIYAILKEIKKNLKAIFAAQYSSEKLGTKLIKRTTTYQ